MPFRVDLDLESADPVHGFCAPSNCEGHSGELNNKSFKDIEILSGHKIEG